jgi:hypothetical protein
VYYDFDSARVR